MTHESLSGSRPPQRRRSQGWLMADLANPRALAITPGPSVAPVADPTRATNAFAQAAAAMKSGRTAEAVNYFAEAYSFSTDNPQSMADALAGQGLAHLRQENFDAARAAFTSALTNNPAHIDAHLGLAELALATQTPREAIPLLQTVLPLLTDERRRAQIHQRLAHVHHKLGRPALSRAHLKAVIIASVGVAPRLWAMLSYAFALERWQWLVIAIVAVSLAFATMTQVIALSFAIFVGVVVWGGVGVYNWK